MGCNSGMRRWIVRYHFAFDIMLPLKFQEVIFPYHSDPETLHESKQFTLPPMGFKSSSSCPYHPLNHTCCQIILVQKKTDGLDSRTHLEEHDTMAPHKNISSVAVLLNPDSVILILVMDSQRSIYVRIYTQNRHVGI